MRSTSQTWRKLRQLPQWWRGSDLAQEPLDEQAAEAPLPVAAPEVAPRLTLSPELQEQVEADFAQIQSDLGSVESQLTALEASLGEVPSEDSIETRLQAIEQLLTSGEREDIPAALPPPPTSAPPSGAGSSVYQEPPFSLISDSIVLPSSLLFEPGGSLLTPTGQQLLDTIVPDLRRYPEATLLVGSHTASNNEPQADRKLTFQQALAVQRYLDQQLGDTGVHWVTLGYGQTRPRVAGAGLEAQQRNQRVEIGIVPQ
jgi:outer membrane protein OmpA-like peptidoglycan-associated protein